MASVGNATNVDNQKRQRQFSGSVTNLMSEKRTAHILKEDSVRFFNLIASLPDWRRKSEYERQTEKESNVLRDQEIHEEDLRNIRKLVQDNPQMSMDQAAEL